MPFNRRLLCATALILGLGTIPCSTSWAEDAPAAAEATSEIVVTARRVEERLQDVPISISVFNQKQLDERNVSYASDLANFTPSLAVNNQFGAEESAFSLRGFYQQTGTAPTVAVYFDEAIAPRAGIGAVETHGGEGAGPGSFFDLQNVQVLKGPQGTLFGINTDGGAVLLVPKRPSQKFEGYVEVGAGNFDQKRVQAVVNVPVNEKLRFRVGIDHQDREGYLNNISGIGPTAFGNLNYLAGRVSVVANITDDIENYTVATFSRSKTIGPTEQIAGCAKTGSGIVAISGPLACAQIARQNAAGPYAVDNVTADPFQYNRNWQVINTTTWAATDSLSIKNIASYGSYIQNSDDQLFGADFLLPSTFGPFAGTHIPFAGVHPEPGIPNSQEETVTEELQAQGQALGGDLQYQGGLYGETSQPTGYSGTLGDSLLPCTNPAAHLCDDVLGTIFTAGAKSFAHPITVGSLGPQMGYTAYHDYGVYAQGTYTITDNLKFTGGLRWTDDIQTAAIQRYTISFPLGMPSVTRCTSLSAVTPGCLQSFRTSAHAPTWVMDLEYTPIEDVNTYVKYSRGYRQGGITPTGADGYFTYGPEHVDAYEVGAKTSFHGAVSGNFNIAGFYNDFTNQQLQTGFYSVHTAASGIPDASPTASIVNAGTSRIYGIEIDSKISPYKGLVFSLDYSYLNSLITQIAPITLNPNSLYNISTPLSFAGNQLPFTPLHKGSLGMEYTLPLDPAIGKVSFGIDYDYTARELVAANAPPAFQYIPATQLVNLNVSWENIYGRPIDANFFMTNVANSVYTTYVTDFYASLGFDTRMIGPPRMFGGSLRYRF